MSGRRIICAGVVLATLAACESPVTRATGPTGPELPPIGLAASAVWLEEREALNRASAARAAEIQAQQQAGFQVFASGLVPVSEDDFRAAGNPVGSLIRVLMDRMTGAAADGLPR